MNCSELLILATQGSVAKIDRIKRLILRDKKKSHFFLVAL